MIPDVNRGDPPQADHQNALIAAVNRLLRPTSGVTPHTQWGIFELTEDVVYPAADDSTYPSSWDEPPDVPYAENCNVIWLNHADNEYSRSGNTENETVYFPTVSTWAEALASMPKSKDCVVKPWTQRPKSTFFEMPRPLPSVSCR